MKPLVYLAGGIAGLSGEDASTWRQNVGSWLFHRGIEALDPMRRKQVLTAQAEISTDFREYQNHGAFFTSQGIMARDYSDVKRCDALLVNFLGAARPSFGTVMELAWAYALQKPAVVAIEAAGNLHDGHPMIHEAMPFRVKTLEEAVDAVAVILNR